MSFGTKVESDDAQFVESVRDETKRQARIERLSRSRRNLGIVLYIQAACLLIIMFVNTIQMVTHEPNTNSLPLVSGWGMFVLFIAFYLYTDLQIKFLKADAARFTDYSGNDSGSGATSTD